MRRSAAVLAALAAVVAPGAVAATAAPPASAQGLADDTAAWVGSVLRVPAEARPLVANAHDAPGAAAWVRCGEPVVYARPWVVRELGEMARGDLYSSEAARILLHETLHRTDCHRLPTEHDRDVEEWAVDALAYDLLPAWSARFTGWRIRVYPPSGGYAEGVRAIRAASRFATGSLSWRGRRARLWRRQLVLADVATRRAMLADANRRREWSRR
ncbi:hypothetical protein [Miltoncostaea marina]|uniref:hypothetical protein n=1 Tax=Miltoncostaea marina TaxID=2843215 RepID=UPI001C3C2466|nr:hypothetical protein [Miltoncostaea marina]